MFEWLARLKDPTRDVYERRYRLLSAVSIVMLFLWIACALVVDGYSPRILFFAVCDLLFVPTMLYTLRSGNIQLGAGASGVALTFLMIPYAFFYNGGIYAGAPNWCIISIVFITLTVSGRLRTFLLASDIVVTTACYALAYAHPELVNPFTVESAYVDSLSSLIITGVEIAVGFVFQLYVSNQERTRLQEQQRQITELNQAQNRFFSNMSHEIRTPVTTIVGLNEMILREDVSDEVASNALHVQAAGKMLLSLVNDILDMSKLESGKMTLSPAEYQVGSLLSEVVGLMWAQAREKGLALHVSVDPELPARLYGDEMRIRQVLLNLLANAVKYTREGSVTLTVGGRRTDNGAFVLSCSVADTGIGIRKENLPRLFSAFRRVDERRNRAIEGTGLGLSIVAQLVDLMGGTVSVSSVYTKGSTFVVEIPQQPLGDERVGVARIESRLGSGMRAYAGPSFTAPGARVLVVDDSAPNLLVAQGLLRDTGMTIHTARSAREALRLTLQHAYHLVFLDHLMPEMDGIACLAELRGQVGGLSKGAKVVAFTANAGSDSKAYYAQAGFDGYVVKPCSGADLERECLRLLPKELLHLSSAGSSIVESSMQWLNERERRIDTLVTTDSIADLPEELRAKWNVVAIPHAVRTEEGVFLDGREIESSGIVSYMGKRDGLVQTVPPDAEAYEEFFAAQLARANHVVHVSISSRIAGSGYSNACEAARSFGDVHVVDSGHLSSGQGLLVLEACRLAAEGRTPEQIVLALDHMRERVSTSFVVDNLAYMARAHMVGDRTRMICDALMVHPVLRLKDGRIRMSRFHLGSTRAAWDRYLASELRKASSIDRRLLFVTYVGLNQRDLEHIGRQIEARAKFDRVVFVQASPAIAVNCGPGTFGLLYLRT